MIQIETEHWPHRVEAAWEVDQQSMRRWLETTFDATTWFLAAANVVYFTHQEDAMRFSLVWT